MTIRPIDIARKLSISTSTLRHYEEWGIVPPVERGENGYRIYTADHVAYFECIRYMLPGYGMELTAEAMRMLQRGEVQDVLWMVKEAQARLHQDKVTADKTIELLESEALDRLDSKGKRKWMTIGEVSLETGIPSSAIRHWEKSGLLSIARDPENGYRLFNSTHLRQILLIRTLRTAVYSLDVIKSVLDEVNHNRIEQARQVARDSLEYIHQLNLHQVHGAHYLYQLCLQLKLIEEPVPPTW